MNSNSCVRYGLRARAVSGLLMFAAFFLAGCQKEPGGQVVAVVGDQEITQQDVRAQAAAEKITNKAALEAATPAIVQRLVDRSLLTGYARDNKLDRGPEYIARRRQLEESLLAYLGLRKLVGNLDSPTSAEAKAYVAANPWTFANRERLSLDQIRFASPSDHNVVRQLTRLGSLDAIAAKLTADGAQFSKAEAFFDTGTVDPRLANQIGRLPNGAIFDVTMGGTSYISQIKSRAPVVAAQSTWEPQALNILRSKMLRDIVQAKMDKLKSSTKIKYDPAYRPKGQ
jgi:EpsD family peptidyl-prolyl cis-trans isomerase